MEIRMEEKAVTQPRTRASAPRVRTGCKTCKVSLNSLPCHKLKERKRKETLADFSSSRYDA
jgi:hypothetical protein